MTKATTLFVNTIEDNPDCEIFTIYNWDSENPIEWKIKPTSLQIIPKDEGHYLVKAYLVEKSGLYKSGFVNVNTPERIIDFVIYNLKEPQYSYAYDSIELDIIPAVASDCFGSYEVYYSRNNPDLSIDILKKGLKISKEKNVIAEDLGYILRDENRYKEALNYFLISEENRFSTQEFILNEIENLYRLLGNIEKANEYKLKQRQL
ncbi:MAG: hypothetical protein ABJK28_10905 [Algibacter sp.]